MTKATAITLNDSFNQVTFLEGRTPETTDEESENSFTMLSEYRDGGVFITHYSGFSEWEMHPKGDEFVQVVEGKTTLILLIDDQEQSNPMVAGQLLVVPQNVWHRFESPNGVKVLTITPQPTEHRIERP